MADAKPAEVPPVHNPEALEDAPKTDARFQNVDLEANAAAAAPPATAATTTTAAPSKSKLTAVSESMEWSVIIAFLALAAIVVMISSATICGGGVTVFGVTTSHGVPCTGIQGWQVAFSTIAAAIALLALIADKAGMLTSERAKEGISVFLFLWAIAGMIVLTFFGDFITVAYANGYFGTQAVLLFSIMALINCSALFKRTVEQAAYKLRSPLLFIMVASAIEMGAAIGPCSPSDKCVSYNAFAIALGVVSLGLSIILVLAAPHLPATVMKVFGVFFIVWWIVGFCVVTFGGPFVTPGNGYFASAVAVIMSLHFFRLTMEDSA